MSYLSDLFFSLCFSYSSEQIRSIDQRQRCHRCHKRKKKKVTSDKREGRRLLARAVAISPPLSPKTLRLVRQCWGRGRQSFLLRTYPVRRCGVKVKQVAFRGTLRAACSPAETREEKLRWCCALTLSALPFRCSPSGSGSSSPGCPLPLSPSSIPACRK